METGITASCAMEMELLQRLTLRARVVAHIPQSMNSGREITGYYFDVSGIHGFVRNTDNTFTTFDAPGMGFISTYPVSISQGGEITGYSTDANGVHGFVRDKYTSITIFNGPYSTVPGGITIPLGINSGGEITGYYTNADYVPRGFLRDSDGTITAWEVPGAGQSGQPAGTTPFSINPGGKITGYYADARYRQHGFVRNKDGTITAFDPPGVISFATFPTSINPSGALTGYYQDSNGVHGFVREH